MDVLRMDVDACMDEDDGGLPLRIGGESWVRWSVNTPCTYGVWMIMGGGALASREGAREFVIGDDGAPE